MGIENFRSNLVDKGKKIAKIGGLSGVLLAGSIGSAVGQKPEQTQGKGNKDRPVAESTQTADKTEENLSPEVRKKIQKIRDEAALELAELEKIEAKIKLAKKRQELREAERPARDTSKIGVSAKDESVKTVTFQEVDILDANGKKIGSAMEGSKKWFELEKRRIKANERIGIAEARGKTHQDNINNSGGYRGDRRRHNNESTMGGANKPWDRRQ